MSILRGASGDHKGWSRQFDDPIPTGDGGELRTLRDAGVYILALPPAEAEREYWQVAMECLISAAMLDPQATLVITDQIRFRRWLIRWPQRRRSKAR